MIDPLRLSEDCTVQPITELISKYYFRIEANDQPGVLGVIAAIFGDYDISISSFIQKESTYNKDSAELVIMTHDSKESLINNAIVDIKDLDSVTNINNVIRIIG